MDNKNKKIELLAPAGNPEKMKTAFAFGADAVYLGIPDFSLRVRINDFGMKEIEDAVEYAHSIGKKVYVTVNIFAHNKHIDKLPKYIEELKRIKPDALIISDPGVIVTVKEIWPDCEIHLSTQANCTNWQSAKFWYEAGVKRIILGREVTLEEIKEIHKNVPEVDLEYFVHGAMCMSYSGRCFLSKYFLDRSGNLGDCVQPCRWNYFISEEKRPEQPLELVEEEHGSYILNSKDMCLIKHLDELVKSGVVSLKIEGRAKSVYYEALVNGIYRKALNMIEEGNLKKDDLEYFYNELNTKLVHRGYTDGFLLGSEADQEINESHQKCDWEFCGQVLEGERKKGKGKSIYVKVHNTLRVGDEIEIVKPFYDIIRLKIEKMVDSKNNEEIEEAHGGSGGKVVIFELDQEVLEYSVLRRKLK